MTKGKQLKIKIWNWKNCWQNLRDPCVKKGHNKSKEIPFQSRVDNNPFKKNSCGSYDHREYIILHAYDALISQSVAYRQIVKSIVNVGFSM